MEECSERLFTWVLGQYCYIVYLKFFFCTHRWLLFNAIPNLPKVLIAFSKKNSRFCHERWVGNCAWRVRTVRIHSCFELYYFVFIAVSVDHYDVRIWQQPLISKNNCTWRVREVLDLNCFKCRCGQHGTVQIGERT